MRIKPHFLAIVLSVLVASFASPAGASLSIIQPTNAVASTELGGFFDRVALRAIDGSGLTSPGNVLTGNPVPAVWPGLINNAGSSNVGGGTMWLSQNVGTAGIPNQWIIFDLGDVQPLRGMHVWNYNESNPGDLTTRAAQDVNISFATTLGSLTPGDPNWFGGMAQTLTRPPGSPTALNSDYTGETYMLPDVDARYILFDIQSNYGSTEFVGLGEVRFLTPEPTKGLMLAVGAIALGLRRRRVI